MLTWHLLIVLIPPSSGAA